MPVDSTLFCPERIGQSFLTNGRRRQPKRMSSLNYSFNPHCQDSLKPKLTRPCGDRGGHANKFAGRWFFVSDAVIARVGRAAVTRSDSAQEPNSLSVSLAAEILPEQQFEY
jgi:hypothetical protein